MKPLILVGMARPAQIAQNNKLAKFKKKVRDEDDSYL